MSELKLDEFGDRMIKLVPKLNIEFDGFENSILTRHEITATQLSILEYISACGQCKMNALVDDLKVKFSAVTASVNRLVKTGFVIHAYDKDHRSVSVALSAKGKKVLLEVNRQRRKVFTQLFSRVNPKKRDQCLAILEKLVGRFNK